MSFDRDVSSVLEIFIGFATLSEHEIFSSPIKFASDTAHE